MSLVDYDVLRIIGKGTYGEVHLVNHKADRKQVSFIFAICIFLHNKSIRFSTTIVAWHGLVLFLKIFSVMVLSQVQ